MCGTRISCGRELVRVDMKEMEMPTFICSDVVEPRVVGGMGGRGESGFEGLEVEGGEINDGGRGRDTGTEEPVCVGLDIRWGGELRVREGRKGGGLVICDEGLEEACVVVGDTTIEVTEEIALSVMGRKMKKKDEIEDGTTVNDDDGGVTEGCKHKGKDCSVGFTMIDVSGGSAYRCRENMGHEMVGPRGFSGPRGSVSVNG